MNYKCPPGKLLEETLSDKRTAMLIVLRKDISVIDFFVELFSFQLHHNRIMFRCKNENKSIIYRILKKISQNVNLFYPRAKLFNFEFHIL